MATSGTVRDSVVRIAVEDLANHVETLEAELRAGKRIELVRGEAVIGEVCAPKAAEAIAVFEKVAMPDFKAQLREIWGNKVLPSGTMTRLIREDRDA